MKKYSILLAALFLLALLAACGVSPGVSSAPPASAPLPAQSTPAPSAPSDADAAYGLVQQMAALDREALSVEAFNTQIWDLCEDAGLGFFNTLSLASERIVPGDALYPFFRGALSHSSSEIFAQRMDNESESSHMLATANVLRTGTQTAEEVAAEAAKMDIGEWFLFVEGHTRDIEFWGMVHYAVDYDIADPAAMKVAGREQRLAAFSGAVQAFASGLGEGGLQGEDAEALLEAELARLSQELSDDAMAFTAQLQSLETSGDEPL